MTTVTHPDNWRLRRIVKLIRFEKRFSKNIGR
jgi:hypothetical protein